VGVARTDLERRSRHERSATGSVNARGSAGNLAWSPDGSMLAFASNRGTHSYIGVFTLASKELRYLDPSLDRDGNPIWSPDGTRIAWMRQCAAPRARCFRPRRTRTSRGRCASPT
jgi:Tol biopolymer transport system component